MSAPAPTSRLVASSLRRLVSDAARIDLSQSNPLVSLRNAIGLVLPLSVAAAAGRPSVGVAIAIGALQTAFADRPGPYRLRCLRMLAVATLAGVTAGLAAALGHSVLPSALLLAALGFLAGLLLTAGPSAAQAGIAATACALVLGHLPQPPWQAAQTGLLVLAGGVLQTALAIAAWPLGRHRPERFALSALYRQLAALAADPIGAASRPPVTPAIDDASAVLRGVGHDHGPSVEAYRVLLDEAIRARQDILVLTGYADRLDADQPAAARAVRFELAHAATVLHAIAATLESGRPAADLQRLLVPAGRSDALVGDSLTGRAAASRVRSLAGQLRAMVETARTGAGEGRTNEDAGRPSGSMRLRDPLAVLRANLSPNSPAARHSLRLAVLVPVTDIFIRSVGVQRGYWVALTILVVLRPDFAQTFQRSLARVAGTLIGLLAASLLLHYLLHDWTPGMIALLGLSFFGMRMAGPTNMALSSMFLGGLVVVLLALSGVPAHTTVVIRLVDTAVGGAIALVAALLWPSWERAQLPDRMVELIAAYQRYLQSMVDPDTTQGARATARRQSRLARSAAEASLDRARAEPVSSQGRVELAASVLAHSHRMVHALTALDATGHAREVYAKVPEFRFLIDAVSASLTATQQAIGFGWRQIKDLQLRSRHAELTGALPLAQLAPDVAAAVVEATDRLVNSVDSMAAVLAEHRGRS
ncbi:MAG TPA: FUSC family protein [Jatrophihabitans sp.]|nr:FUSC family protein [Jatrophihabitans sp.]